MTKTQIIILIIFALIIAITKGRIVIVIIQSILMFIQEVMLGIGSFTIFISKQLNRSIKYLNKIQKEEDEKIG